MKAINFNGFIYKDVTDQAKKVKNGGLFDFLSFFDLYELHLKDKSESKINSFEELDTALEKGATIGIEVGKLEDLSTDLLFIIEIANRLDRRHFDYAETLLKDLIKDWMQQVGWDEETYLKECQKAQGEDWSEFYPKNLKVLNRILEPQKTLIR